MEPYDHTSMGLLDRLLGSRWPHAGGIDRERILGELRDIGIDDGWMRDPQREHGNELVLTRVGESSSARVIVEPLDDQEALLARVRETTMRGDPVVRTSTRLCNDRQSYLGLAILMYIVGPRSRRTNTDNHDSQTNRQSR